MVPKESRVRPTTAQTQETLFNICQYQIEGAAFLDLFAGSGAIGFEALSRGASHVTFVESNRLAIQAIKKNIQTLQVEGETTLYGYDIFKALSFLSQNGVGFDLIYADPPYEAGFSAPLLQCLDQQQLLKPEGTLYIEDALFQEPPLKHLTCTSHRKIGRAYLFEYMRIQ